MAVLHWQAEGDQRLAIQNDTNQEHDFSPEPQVLENPGGCPIITLSHNTTKILVVLTLAKDEISTIL